MPILRRDRAHFAVYEPEATRMDVDAIWQGYRKKLLQNGGRIILDAEVYDGMWLGKKWALNTKAGMIEARDLVNAGGPWGDVVSERCGVQPIGLMLLRRTAFVNRVASGADADLLKRLPFVFTAKGDLYFRPEGGDRILISPSDETPTVPRDEQPELIDIARSTARFQQITMATLAPRPDRAWAGIRTFSRDRRPTVGFDGTVPNFFHLLGQGGYGIQTAPAMSCLAAALLLDEGVPDDLTTLGFREGDVSPRRFEVSYSFV